jgi:hypothetical protein
MRRGCEVKLSRYRARLTEQGPNMSQLMFKLSSRTSMLQRDLTEYLKGLTSSPWS